MQCVHFYEFEIKVRLWRWAWHNGYQWCERSCTLAVRNNKLSSRESRVYLIIIYGKISCVPCKVINWTFSGGGGKGVDISAGHFGQKQTDAFS